MAYWFESKGQNIFKKLSKQQKRDVTAVEGNAQGFRIVAQTENHVFDGGLQLTYATLGAFHKYPWTSQKPKVRKFGSFLSEETILDRLGEKLGLVETGSHCWCRHPLAHLVEAADDICYSIIDLEDAVELRILSFDQVADFFLEAFGGKEQKKIRDGFSSAKNYRSNLAHLRGFVFDKAIAGAIEAYISAYSEIMEGRYDGNVFDVLELTDPRVKLVFGAKLLGREQVYTDIKKTEMEIGCYSTFDTLLTEFCKAMLDQAQALKPGSAPLSVKSAQILLMLGDHAPTLENAPPGGWNSYQCLRRVIDYVTGMTDNYATYISRQFQGMGFSGVQRP